MNDKVKDINVVNLDEKKKNFTHFPGENAVFKFIRINMDVVPHSNKRPRSRSAPAVISAARGKSLNHYYVC